jgi:hypothetical protein
MKTLKKKKKKKKRRDPRENEKRTKERETKRGKERRVLFLSSHLFWFSLTLKFKACQSVGTSHLLYHFIAGKYPQHESNKPMKPFGVMNVVISRN